MTTIASIANAQQCPYCKGWITLPLRRARASFEKHKLACRQEVPDSVQVPEKRTECATCGHHVEYHRLPTGCIDCECAWTTVDANTRCPSCGKSYPVADVPLCPMCGDQAEETVQRATLWDGVIDTHQTEAELNGFRATQGALL